MTGILHTLPLLVLSINMMAINPFINDMNHTMTQAKEEQTKDIQTAVFGSGCFWCSEAIFSRLNGVSHVVPGYSGGQTQNPSYEDVKTGSTGHAEVIRISFDPNIISFIQLLEVFFRTHDPTTLNRQGADVGTQYRSVIFYHSEEQKEVASQVKKRLDQEKIWDNPIVTEISQAKVFYEAEQYHHKYFEKNPTQAYCQFVILPKVEKFKGMFEDMLRNK